MIHKDAGILHLSRYNCTLYCDVVQEMYIVLYLITRSIVFSMILPPPLIGPRESIRADRSGEGPPHVTFPSKDRLICMISFIPSLTLYSYNTYQTNNTCISLLKFVFSAILRYYKTSFRAFE